MSAFTTGFLLLAMLVCITNAQITEAGQTCLCQRVRNKIFRGEMKDIQIYHATVHCNKVEIVITNEDGFRYCLNPQIKIVREMMANMLKKSKVATTSSTTSTVSASTEKRTSANI